MKRRSFLSGLAATVGGIFMPYEPEVIYSFPSKIYRDPRFAALDELFAQPPSWLRIYDGSGFLLAEAPVEFSPASQGRMTAKPFDFSVEATGTMRGAQVENELVQIPVDLQLNTMSLVTGASISINSFDVTMGK